MSLIFINQILNVKDFNTLYFIIMKLLSTSITLFFLMLWLCKFHRDHIFRCHQKNYCICPSFLQIKIAVTHRKWIWLIKISGSTREKELKKLDLYNWRHLGCYKIDKVFSLETWISFFDVNLCYNLKPTQEGDFSRKPVDLITLGHPLPRQSEANANTIFRDDKNHWTVHLRRTISEKTSFIITCRFTFCVVFLCGAWWRIVWIHCNYWSDYFTKFIKLRIL